MPRAKADKLGIRTIADLAGASRVTPAHVTEAIELRCLDREVLPGRFATA